MFSTADLDLPDSTLPQRALSELCRSFLDGSCPHGERCGKSHEVCRVLDGVPDRALPKPTGSSPNSLSPFPRLPSQNESPFDDEGPGELCGHGPRHDNDHISIRDIRVLPTTDEILCLRRPYMPFKAFDRAHFLPPGEQRLLDTVFRQLRHDNVEVIIDICYHAFQTIVASSGTDTDGHDTRQVTPRGHRWTGFRDVAFEDMLFHPSKGLIPRLSFSCPTHLKSRRIHTSGLLEHGMLVALIGLYEGTSTLSTTFFEVHLRESTDAMNPRGGKGLRSSVQLSFARGEDQDDVRRVLYYAHGVLPGKFLLVEFPNVLLAGFSHCLQQLQRQINRYRLPFAQHIVSAPLGEKHTRISPPRYANSPKFTFDLGSLSDSSKANTTDEMHFSVAECQGTDQPNSIMKKLRRLTTLDEGQATALHDSLSRELAFTQGPPGTGKTFLGVSLVKTILASQSQLSTGPKPVLAVSMTNHALDSFLADLLNRGVSRIARLGGGSREDWTKAHGLRELTAKLKQTRIECGRIGRSCKNVETLSLLGSSWCETLSSSNITWHGVREHLRASYKDVFDQFAALDQSGSFDTHRVARHAGAFGYHCWSRGIDLDGLRHLAAEFSTYLGVDPTANDSVPSSSSLILQMLEAIVSSARDVHDLRKEKSVWNMSPVERKSLMTTWKDEIGVRNVADKVAEVHRRHQNAVGKRKAYQQNIDSRALEEQQVIGMTTTACAKFWPLLNKLGIRVVICEEAGEIMEAHTLCTLFPSVEHAIFIGDPLQLRPQVAEPVLSLETKIGSSYRLDESLFERLMSVHPSDPSHFPISRLNLQRRMHPDIADICRVTLYPFLKDHDTTSNRPEVAGMAQRMFWLDHDQPEYMLDGRSYSNDFEVEMVAGLVEYLIRGNEYDQGDIAILTPYNGQLAKLTRRLSSTCSIYLSDKDRESLLDDGLLSETEAQAGTKANVSIINMLRVATIDNFQGEEAKIVIMSTVRSNKVNRVGFLKTPNRINVGCSRARDGFYIVGNANLMSKVPTWLQIM
ncbi:MAG: hypothetical protein M1837_005941 [Sclerophora amabilis]|nr:MAG: hypothetical protein M1837_005941 [Sclerophora amabilis]